MDKVETAKAGVKTSEFWVAIAVKVIGLLLTAYGAHKGSDALIEFGAVVIAVGGGAYIHSRGTAKRDLANVRKVSGLLLAAGLLFLAGCCSGHIRAAAIDGTLRRVIARDRAAVQVDPGLSDVQRRVNLRDDELLEQVLDEALAEPE